MEFRRCGTGCMRSPAQEAGAPNPGLRPSATQKPARFPHASNLKSVTKALNCRRLEEKASRPLSIFPAIGLLRPNSCEEDNSCVHQRCSPLLHPLGCSAQHRLLHSLHAVTATIAGKPTQRLNGQAQQSCTTMIAGATSTRVTRGITSMKRTLNMTRVVAIGLTASGTPAEEFPEQAGWLDGSSLKPPGVSSGDTICNWICAVAVQAAWARQQKKLARQTKGCCRGRSTRAPVRITYGVPGT